MSKNPITEAAERKLTLQTEAAINLGIGVVLQRVCGCLDLTPADFDRLIHEREITITPQEIADFSAKYRVEQTVNPDGSYTLRVVER